MFSHSSFLHFSSFLPFFSLFIPFPSSYCSLFQVSNAAPSDWLSSRGRQMIGFLLASCDLEHFLSLSLSNPRITNQVETWHGSHAWQTCLPSCSVVSPFRRASSAWGTLLPVSPHPNPTNQQPCCTVGLLTLLSPEPVLHQASLPPPPPVSGHAQFEHPSIFSRAATWPAC